MKNTKVLRESGAKKTDLQHREPILSRFLANNGMYKIAFGYESVSEICRTLLFLTVPYYAFCLWATCICTKKHQLKNDINQQDKKNRHQYLSAILGS